MKTKGILVVLAMLLLAGLVSIKSRASASPSRESSRSALAQNPPNPYAANSQQPPEQVSPETLSTIEKIFGPTKQVEVRDPFYNNILAFTITIPKDWFFEGTILHGPGCEGLDYQGFAYRAYSPDAAFGVQSAPKQTFYYWDDNRAHPKGPACKFIAPLSASDYAYVFSGRARPNAQVDQSEIALDFDRDRDTVEKRNQNNMAVAARYRIPAEHDTFDDTRTRIHYDWEGYSEDEWLHVAILYRDMPQSVFVYDGGPHPGHQDWMHFLASDVGVVGTRAPKGKLDQADPGLQAINDSVIFSPEFLQATFAYKRAQVQRNVAAMWQVTNAITQMSQQQMLLNYQNSQAFMNMMTQQHNQFMAQQQQRFEAGQQNAAAQMNRQTAQARGFIAQMNQSSAQTRDFQDVLLNQQFYVNPGTGETATISGRFNHAWANGSMTSNATGIAQSNGNFNPNGSLGYNWIELMPIHH